MPIGRRRRTRRAAAGGAGVLPIDIDFSALEDGAMPAPLTGATWVVSGGKAINTPTHGATLITDGDMEAAGVTNWAAVGTPTAREKSNTQVFAGSQSLHITADANNEGASQNFTAENGKWYRFLAQAYAAAGAANLQHNLAGTFQATGNTTAAWVQFPMTCYHADTTGTRLIRLVGSSGTDAYYDDAAIQEVDFASTLAALPPTQADIVLRAPLTQAAIHTQIGFILNLDSLENPQNFVLVFIWWILGTSIRIGVLKCVNGVLSQVALPSMGGYAAGRELEVRKTGTSYAVYYNSALVNTYTISDASIVDNTIHGIFSPHGGNSLNRFFAVREVTVLSHVYAGSSITASTAPVNYRDLTQSWIRENLITYAPIFTNAALGSRNTWNHLMRQDEFLASPVDVLVFDAANDIVRDIDQASFEAFIRLLHANNPHMRVVVSLFPRVTDPDVNSSVDAYENAERMELVRETCEHYNVTVVDFAAEVRRLVNEEGRNLSEFLGDNIHPADGGHQLEAELLEPLLPSLYSATGMMPATLPERLYPKSADYENTPVRILGTDYDSRTGTWGDTGTRIESSETGATVTFSATCQSFGVHRADAGTNTVQVSIDGGAFESLTFNYNGTEIPSGRGEHEIVIKVVSGTVRIDEFWAI